MELCTSTILLLLPIFILLSLHCYWHGTRVGRCVDKIPGPRTLPVLGNALDLNLSLEQLWRYFRTNSKKFYPVFKIWIFNWSFVNIQHPDDLEVLLSSRNIQKSMFYDFVHPWLKDGLLTSTGEKWHRRRKILTPAFHFNILPEFVESFVEHTDRLVAELRAEAGRSAVTKELASMFSKLTLSIICETAMGTTIDSSNHRHTEYLRTIHGMGDLLFYRTRRPWLKNDFVFSLTEKGREHARSLSILHDFTARIIRERQQYHDETGGSYLSQLPAENAETTDDDVNVKMNRRRLALLDLLIAAARSGGDISDDGIREEVDTFVFEGHDTTAMGFLFTTLLLAEHKEAQEICRREVGEVMESCGGKLAIKDVQKLNYLDRCIREAQRLYPSVPMVSRQITEDIQLKNCFLPVGSIAHIHFFDTHRNPNFWPHPDVFDPDRFLPDQSKNRHPFAYVPFSAGPRNCIGQKFGMLELKTVMAGLLHNFHLEPVERAANVPVQVDMVLRAVHPVHVKLLPIAK